MKSSIAAAFAMLLISGTVAASAEVKPQGIALNIKQTLQFYSDLDEHDLSQAQLSAIDEYYESIGYVPLWTSPTGAMRKAHDLVAILSNSHRHGLRQGDYALKRIRRQLSASSLNDLARLEVNLSKAFVAYAHDLTVGRIDPERVSRSIHFDPKAEPVASLLKRAATAESLKPLLRDLEPSIPQYRRLIRKIAEYEHVAANGGWSPVSANKPLKLGGVDEAVVALRIRLTESGDLPPGNRTGTEYDAVVANGVRTFQSRHGLAVDGVAGPNTLREMNISVLDRIAQMDFSLERLRWMRDDLGPRHVFVNLADQFLTLVDNDRIAWRSRLVVGKAYHATPVFAEKMTYLVFNPNWNIPRSIATKEMLPKLRKDPTALERRNIKVLTGWGEDAQVVDPRQVNWRSISRKNFPFRFRQGPGSNNALGSVKFMFPNRFNIYIHDTPSKSLFSRVTRTFSHGCMRVQNPHKLAELLLDEQGWSDVDIQTTLQLGDRRVISLKKPWPVYVTYLTAWVDEDGVMQFRRDVYGRDKRLQKALAGLGA